MPRSYASDRRRAAADATRDRILAATRTLLDGDDAVRLSLDRVARTADVSRQTVYNAFGSRAGLLAALCDAMAERGGMERLAGAFAAPDLDAALGRLVEVFCTFWAHDRTAHRRLRALCALDPDLVAVVADRDDRRRRALHALLGRHGATADDATVDVAWTLTGFPAYDALAIPTRTPEQVVEVTTSALRRLLGRKTL